MQVSMAGWVLCVTLVLAALAGAQGQSYQAFQQKHVDNPRTRLPARNYCNTMMARRGMTRPVCKFTNTFVHAPGMTVARACSRTPDGQGYYTTPNRLSVTICRLSGGSPRPPCRYRIAQTVQHYVRVGCRGGRPVHLQNTIP
ncbi:ribonuclease-like isoform X2 [Malurus melanocephalus]|uniref:ribonuclease-like isoform X2 n=1 Tax=Malurus melanocephalus TaxID=175006 RepID=UPI002549742E|nr:ribonuclease-like isoform X2 [Malurus melanocephalus]